MKEEAKKQKWRRLNGVVPRNCALVYSSDRPDPKTYILGCSLAPPSKKAQSETDSSLLPRIVTGTTWKLLNGKVARRYRPRAWRACTCACVWPASPFNTGQPRDFCSNRSRFTITNSNSVCKARNEEGFRWGEIYFHNKGLFLQ